MYDLLIKNGRIVTPELIQEGSVAVKGGKIAAVLAPDAEVEAKKTIDAEGKYVFPGAIDTHAHLNDPGFEWREDYAHGTAAAIVGGYTTIIDMPLQNEPAMTTPELFDIKEAKVSPNAYCDYAFWGGLIPDNLDQLKALDEKGVVAFKSFIGPVSPDYSSLSYGQAYEAMEILKECGARAGFHCEDYSMIKMREKHVLESKPASELTWRDFLDSRTPASERVATEAIIAIAEELGCHVNTLQQPYMRDILLRYEEFQQSAKTEKDVSMLEQRIKKLENILSHSRNYNARLTSENERLRRERDEYEDKYRRLLGRYQVKVGKMKIGF